MYHQLLRFILERPKSAIYGLRVHSSKFFWNGGVLFLYVHMRKASVERTQFGAAGFSLSAFRPSWLVVIVK